jgi:hypothetical protein
MNTILLAPSGIGKTHLAERSANVFADGDTIIRAAVGWPEFDWSAKAIGEDFVHYIHLINWRVLCRAHEMRTILFCGHVDDDIIGPNKEWDAIKLVAVPTNVDTYKARVQQRIDAKAFWTEDANEALKALDYWNNLANSPGFSRVPDAMVKTLFGC